jgi:DNA-binding CsgD family transcriptional regulator
MRAVTITIKREEGFHPSNSALADEPSVHRVAIHHFQLLDNSTTIFLIELRGNLERAEHILSNHSSVISCEVSGDTHGVAFVHSRPTDVSKKMIGLVQKHQLAVEAPIEHVEGDGVRITFIGDHLAIQTAISEIPADVDVTIERIESYRKRSTQVPDLLTDRQREIASLAVAEGYYDIPRKTSQEQLAHQLDISPGTLSEHLSKIESAIFKHLYE